MVPPHIALVILSRIFTSLSDFWGVPLAFCLRPLYSGPIPVASITCSRLWIPTCFFRSFCASFFYAQVVLLSSLRPFPGFAPRHFVFVPFVFKLWSMTARLPHPSFSSVSPPHEHSSVAFPSSPSITFSPLSPPSPLPDTSLLVEPGGFFKNFGLFQEF